MKSAILKISIIVLFLAATLNGTVYGQDLTFTTPASTPVVTSNGLLAIAKYARNLSSGKLNWSTFASASPSDIMQFALLVKANGPQDLHNVVVKDTLPSSLIYKGGLTINNTPSSGDIIAGINLGTIFAGQTKTVVYRAQVSLPQNFSLGMTTLANSVSVKATEAYASASSTIIVSKTGILGEAITIDTGLTNNILEDSFLLPLLIILSTAWLYKSGSLFKKI